MIIFHFKNLIFTVCASSDPSVDDSLEIHPLSSSRTDICQVREIASYIFFTVNRGGGGRLQGLTSFPLDQ